jgi:hypothetical protein
MLFERALPRFLDVIVTLQLGGFLDISAYLLLCSRGSELLHARSGRRFRGFYKDHFSRRLQRRYHHCITMELLEQ